MTQQPTAQPKPQGLPPEIDIAFQRLGWTRVRVQLGSYGGQTGYLVRDAAGIVEPHTYDAILTSAATVGAHPRVRPLNRSDT